MAVEKSQHYPAQLSTVCGLYILWWQTLPSKAFFMCFSLSLISRFGWNLAVAIAVTDNIPAHCSLEISQSFEHWQYHFIALCFWRDLSKEQIVWNLPRKLREAAIMMIPDSPLAPPLSVTRSSPSAQHPQDTTSQHWSPKTCRTFMCLGVCVARQLHTGRTFSSN